MIGAAMPAAVAGRRLRTVPGIGAWTVAETLQRSHGDPDAVSVGDLRINLAARRVYKNDEEIELTGREYSILELLVRRRGDVVARTTLSEHLYSDDSELMSNAIDVHVASLRRKLGAAVIQTRRGLGYLIDG